jgi:hypothetical protein
MIKLLIGLLILLSPFLILAKFNKKGYSFYVISFIIITQFLIGFVTQIFNRFTYAIVLSLNILLLISLFYLLYLRKINGFESSRFSSIKQGMKNIKIDWAFLFVILVVSICLFAVHFNYSGGLTTSTGATKVTDQKITTPYYSDEWVGVSMAKYSIETGKLPFKNPLSPYGDSFHNLEFGSHTLFSELFLITDLDPLTSYSLFSTLAGILVCILVYFILRYNNLEKTYSAIGAMSVPLIVNSSNLPGIWYLLPLIVGLICLLLSFIFMNLSDKRMTLLLGLFTLLFYPPLFLFFTPAFIIFILKDNIEKKEKIKYISFYLGICTLVFILLSSAIFYITKFNLSETTSFILQKLIYPSFTLGRVPDYSPWKVLPLAILVIGLFGIYKYKKDKLLLTTPLAIGALFWALYSFLQLRVIIEYQRDVVVSSILLIMFAAFGLKDIIGYISQISPEHSKKIKTTILAILFILFITFSFFYTQRTSWQKLTLNTYQGKSIMPNAPATSYLTAEDLRLFSNLSKTAFLSTPWKGLVIGTATGNYPIESKSSTLTNQYYKYSDFIKLSCDDQIKLSKQKKFSYIYSQGQSNCTSFSLLGQSKEGFYLYKLG